MIEFYLLMIIILIALMTLIISRYNRKQADALRDVASTAADWLITDILKHRQEKRKEIQIEDPLAWIEKYSDCSDLSLLRKFESIPAVEFACKTGTLVVTPRSPSQMLEILRPHVFNIHIPVAMRKNKVPLLSFKWSGKPKARVFFIGLSELDWFDVEVDQVFEKLEMPLKSQIYRLWFYHIQTDRR